jgi:hypothetical protein
MRVKKEKRSKKERQEGLWKLTTGPTTNINSKTYAD